MELHLRRIVPACIALALILCTVHSSLGTDAATAIVPLQNSGSDPDATGSLATVLNPTRSIINVRASRLERGKAYTLTIDGQRQASAKANSLGVVSFSLANPRGNAPGVLTIDPRGRSVAVVDGSGTPVLEAIVSGPGEPEASSITERAAIPQVSARRGTAVSQFTRTRGGKSTFGVTLQQVSGSNWLVYVNGRPEAEIKVSQGVGRVRFSTDPTSASEQVLDFDPRGSILDISQGTNLVFSGKVEARARNLSFASPSVRPSSIPPTGAAPGAVALVRYRVNRDASREFHVELEDVPAGDYELFVNDALEAVIRVVPTATGTEGEVEFAANSDDADKLPLDFDPLTAVFSVRQGGTVYFEGTLTKGVPGAGGSDAPVLIDESLTSSGLDSDASGHASFEIRDDGRHKFGVEIEDVAAGTYALFVGDVFHGNFVAQLQGGRVRGEVEFASPTDDQAKRPLTFDPRGQIVQVRSSAGTLFSHLFGLNEGHPNTTAPLHLDFPLFALPTASGGRATAEIKRDDRGGFSFDVEIEDAPVGSYVLYVGGVPRGTISVVNTDRGTRGHIEFENDPGPGEWPLDFDTLGQVISVERDGALWFERTAPTGG